MIVVDTSALIAVVNNEAMASLCSDVLVAESEALICAGTLTEALIVARRKKVLPGLTKLLGQLPLSVIDLDEIRAERAAAAYALWGKGFHTAALNFGDCFAYATAKEFDCPLLYVSNDFAQTDVRAALASPSNPM
ncbi:MAG: type II toxin-antitoxin system VapC family toxin [Alphaproteobacteria bacterium]|nr:type II toxin-antitoxin system VapC family toxin [Alphaproteobacteria bacterium]MBU1548307.1 type II toxin-antitoxin system VapC family toxin [Alphaproteobacteria bacterium]MBU2335931.1 type II toxin-antitoxin system VapC family toxin [Alphaproteobacteria bacterium]MBU2390674.1 type II toxin-antitoxin system VapC family toxin [Alphaproteobacteria bacterium]